MKSKQSKLLTNAMFKTFNRTKVKSFDLTDLDGLNLLKKEKMINFKSISIREYNVITVENLKITKVGFDFLRKEKINSKKWNNPHDKILYKFMKYLNENNHVLCFSDFDLGSKRPDILTIDKCDNFENLNPIIYEIKHSRSDFMSDIKNTKKRETYLNYSNKFYYVCNYGLIKKEEVPEEAGLIYILSDEKIEIIKEPKERKEKINNENIQELMLTLIVRNIYSKNNKQVVYSQNKNYRSDLVAKYEARNKENSFIFTSDHKSILAEIKLSSLPRINLMNIHYYEDLLFWDLICFEYDNFKLTNKGEQLKKHKRNEMLNIPNYFDKKNCVILEGKDLNLKFIDYITIPMTKKSKNINIKYYFENEENAFNCFYSSEDIKSHQYLIIEKNEKYIQKDKNIGSVSIQINSKADPVGLYISKRAKRQNVSDKNINEILFSILLFTSKNNEYVLFS